MKKKERMLKEWRKKNVSYDLISVEGEKRQFYANADCQI